LNFFPAAEKLWGEDEMLEHTASQLAGRPDELVKKIAQNLARLSKVPNA
jgi:hypothetical protein